LKHYSISYLIICDNYNILEYTSASILQNKKPEYGTDKKRMNSFNLLCFSNVANNSFSYIECFIET